MSTLKDPVCGMDVDETDLKQTYHGRDYFFCNPRCRDKFKADPDAYVGGTKKEKPAAAGAKYTCPMHPEIVKDGPGDCPICGMALEPLTPTGDEPEDGTGSRVSPADAARCAVSC